MSATAELGSVKSSGFSALGKWLAASAAIAAVAFISGCVQSPHDLQEIAGRTTPIRFQTTTTSSGLPVIVECTPASHGGPYFVGSSAATWTQVATLATAQQPLQDGTGSVLFSANGNVTPPAGCWRFDQYYNMWFVAVRVKHVISDSAGAPIPIYFSVFDKKGLECLGTAIGRARSWNNANYQPCEVANNPDKYVLLYSKT
jgi:hypothetical protein